MTHQLELISERPQDIIIIPTVSGMAAECRTEGMALRQVLVLQHGTIDWRAYEAHQYPDGQWSGLLRLPLFRWHPVPRTDPDLIAYCRWLFAPLRTVSS